MYSCISDIEACATANMAELNDNKRELMLVTPIGTKHIYSLPISTNQIAFKQSAKNLGFTLDDHLAMKKHDSIIAQRHYC